LSCYNSLNHTPTGSMLKAIFLFQVIKDGFGEYKVSTTHDYPSLQHVPLLRTSRVLPSFLLPPSVPYEITSMQPMSSLRAHTIESTRRDPPTSMNMMLAQFSTSMNTAPWMSRSHSRIGRTISAPRDVGNSPSTPWMLHEACAAPGGRQSSIRTWEVRSPRHGCRLLHRRPNHISPVHHPPLCALLLSP
jgi:hypothetical protein